MSETNTAKRVRQSRDRMRARGMRLVQLWVPDTRERGFAEELARQCRSLAEHPDHELDAWLDQANEEVLAEPDASGDFVRVERNALSGFVRGSAQRAARRRSAPGAT